MEIVNLTPHAISIGDRTISPSGTIARVSVSLSPAGDLDGIPLVHGTYGEVTGLPYSQKGVLLIVSALVRCALPNRKDLASPADLVRNDQGQIVGARALEINA